MAKHIMAKQTMAKQIMANKRVLIAGMVLLLGTVLPGMAAIQLDPPFGEHMVLQQGVPVSIWGTGCPGGDTVRLSFAGQSVTARCDWTGRWMVRLAPMKAGGPYQMLVQIGGVGRLSNSSAATAQGFVELNDIMIGEVRIMLPPSGGEVVTMSKTGGTAKDAAAPSAWVRVYKDPARLPGGPIGSAGGHWTVDLPRLSSKTYSDESYAFARGLYNRLHEPIGVIEGPDGP